MRTLSISHANKIEKATTVVDYYRGEDSSRPLEYTFGKRRAIKNRSINRRGNKYTRIPDL